MKKFLLLVMALAWSVTSAVAQEETTPVFPTTFDVTLSAEGLTLKQGEDMGVYSIDVTGECAEDEFTLTVAVPEGWDGFVGLSDVDFDPNAQPMSRSYELEFAPVSLLLESGMKEGNSFTFPVDGEEHSGQFYLVKGDMAEVANQILVTVNVTKKTTEPELVFPNTFDVTLSAEGLTLKQGEDMGVYSIDVTGECAEDEFTLTVAVPEGWDGFVGLSDVDFDPNAQPMSRSYELEFAPVSLLLESGMKAGNSFTFPVDGEEHSGQFYLVKGDMAEVANQILVTVNVTKKVTEPEPVFPTTFDVTLSAEGLTLKQGEDMGVYSIDVTGECAEEEFTVTLAVPEGWDGFVGLSDVDFDPNAQPMSRSYELEFAPVSLLLESGMKEGNSFTFPVDGEEHSGQFYLVKGDMAEVANQILVTVNVTKKVTEPEPVFPTTFDVTLSAEGLTLKQGEDMGVYSIDVTGECAEDEFTLTVAVPEGWDGFVGLSDVDFDPNAQPMSRSYELEFTPLENLLAFGMKEGNSFTFPVDGEEHSAQLYLVKGDMAEVANQILVTVNVTKKVTEPEPVFPTTFDVTLSAEGLTLKQGEDMGVYSIDVTGECADDEFTLTVAVPEGWDGFVGLSDVDFDPNAQPMSRSYELEFTPLENLLAFGMKEGNSFTFPVDGEEHSAQLYLVKGDMAEVANQILVTVNVKKDGQTAIESISGSINSGIRYYDLHGVEVKAPKSGVYVRISDGKATKVVVK